MYYDGGHGDNINKDADVGYREEGVGECGSGVIGSGEASGITYLSLAFGSIRFWLTQPVNNPNHVPHLCTAQEKENGYYWIFDISQSFFNIKTMAPPYHVSIPSFQSCEGLIVGRSTRLRFHECKKNTTKIWLPHPSGRLKHAGITYCLHLALGASLCSPGAATNMKALAVLSESMQKFASSYTQCLMVADLDPQFAKVLIGITGPFLSAFSLLFILRIVMSWYPKLPLGKFPYVIAYAPTEPFLVITRKVIPPLGGVDVTPVVWFGFVSFLNEILVGPQGLLVLLSQQT